MANLHHVEKTYHSQVGVLGAGLRAWGVRQRFRLSSLMRISSARLPSWRNSLLFLSPSPCLSLSVSLSRSLFAKGWSGRAGKARSVEMNHSTHPAGNSGANLKSISYRCYLREVASEWELTRETIYLPLGCLQGGEVTRGLRVASSPCLFFENCILGDT